MRTKDLLDKQEEIGDELDILRKEKGCKLPDGAYIRDFGCDANLIYVHIMWQGFA